MDEDESDQGQHSPMGSLCDTQEEPLSITQDIQRFAEENIDPAFLVREQNLPQNETADEMWGRFVLRNPQEVTRLDIEALKAGNNNLIELAQEHCNLDTINFLNEIFRSWNTASGDMMRPVVPPRMAADSMVPVGLIE